MDEDYFLDLLKDWVNKQQGLDMEQILLGDEEPGEIIISFTGLVEHDVF